METSIYITKLSDSINNLDSLIDEKISKIIFKMKKYYVICI